MFEQTWISRSFLVETPLFAIWLVGIIVAVINIHRHPQAATAALIVFLVFIVKAIAFPFVQIWAIRQQMNQVGASDWVFNLYWVTAFLDHLVDAILWGILLLAIFGWRRGARQYYD
jgi:hypothetical protein